ncbi:hypothetical protein BDF21DRAFT_455970 [Thamnidium elegans]|nr:hypothetical protein BDF21DRAFT_455970 [Thamnidium elegans]
MKTNNFVESWYNQLKSTCSQRKRNRRADRLIFILVNDIEPDFIVNTNIIQLNVGRMDPEERRRRRELNAEAINEEVLFLLIEQSKDSQNKNEVIYKRNILWKIQVYTEIRVLKEAGPLAFVKWVRGEPFAFKIFGGHYLCICLGIVAT